MKAWDEPPLHGLDDELEFLVFLRGGFERLETAFALPGELAADDGASCLGCYVVRRAVVVCIGCGRRLAMVRELIAHRSTILGDGLSICESTAHRRRGVKL